MSTPAEKAKARREKILARSLRGNKVSMVTAETMAAEETANTEIGQKNEEAVSTGENSPPSKAEEAPKKDDPSSEEAPSSSTTESTTLTGPAVTKELEEKDLDAMLEAEVEASKPTEEIQAQEEKKPISRPLAERRRLIAEKRARAKAEAAASTLSSGDNEASTPAADDEGEDKPVEFINKSAREVEKEIAAITSMKSDVADADNDSTLKELKEEKVLLGRDRGSTGSGPASLRRRSRVGAGAGGSKKGDSSEEAVLSEKDAAKEKELSRKIAQMAQKERVGDVNAVPKLARAFIILAVAAYTGYTSYLQSANNALTTELLKQELHPSKMGFSRAFFDFENYKPSWMEEKANTDGKVTEGLPEDLEAAFDEASTSQGAKMSKGRAKLNVGDTMADLAPTFECSKAWLDGTSIPFLVIMALSSVSDRILKKSSGKDEGIAGYLTWFWENYEQGFDLILEYVFNYFGEYSAYWMVIVLVSSGLSYRATHFEPEALDWDVSNLESSSEL